ncbi:MAG: hypothetical protein OXC46_05670 [Thaumarchaeota archaeon]|nr:hypothetical protein [Nitrososphaerota archaeon]
MVDNIPTTIRNVLGIVPAAEKLLEQVFEKGRFIEMEEFGVKIRLPTVDVLLAPKFIVLPRRNKDHKKWKDIADIYALIWYSEEKLDVSKSKTLTLISQKDIQNAFSTIKDIDFQKASNAIGVKLDEMKNVINGFIK